MRIRHAQESDAAQIHSLATELSIQNGRTSDQGFLVYVLSEQEYRLRIGTSDFFYVAQQEGQICGFLMCYSDKTLLALIAANAVAHEDGIMLFVQQQGKPFIFGDQIGVRSDDGASILLMQKLLTDAKEHQINKMYVAILERPIPNQASKQFCSKLGFQHKATVRNSDGYEWGIYELTI